MNALVPRTRLTRTSALTSAFESKSARDMLKSSSSHFDPSNLSRQTIMSKFANVVTIEVAPGRRDQVVTLLLAHKARLKDEPGTLQFEVLLPKDDDTKVRVYEMYRDAAAFEGHLSGPSLAQWKEETAGMVVKLHGVRCAVVDESVH